MGNRRRDRHGRGLRGPLALPNEHGATVRLRRSHSRDDFFTECVAGSAARINKHCPEALRGVELGVEEVPHLPVAWSGNQVPLAAAIEAGDDHPARVVVYRRPLEHRAASRRGLRILVHRTIVEQLAALTGLTQESIDPEGYGLDTDW
ncbi:metallopeptidase family protein [Granulicoccus sp. GXG6511]|uniref:metallopeptidase family protein n=1 Tax=Granulicoccus sp. GXG6511 TaxID=3381351 RepID=UPI003D7F166A